MPELDANFLDRLDRSDTRYIESQRVQSSASPQPELTPNIRLDNEDEDFTVGDYAVDVLRGFGNGVVDFGTSVYGLADYATGGLLPGDVSELEPAFGETETFLGSLSDGIAQFGVGLALSLTGAGAIGLAGKLQKGLSIGAKTAQALSGAVAGGVADFISFNEHEERLSNLIQNTPLANPVTDYLAADKDDGVIEGRIKNVLEGLGVGAAVGAVFMGSLRGLKAGKSAAALRDEQAIQETGKSLKQQIDEAFEQGFARMDAEDAAAGGKSAVIDPKDGSVKRELRGVKFGIESDPNVKDGFNFVTEKDGKVIVASTTEEQKSTIINFINENLKDAGEGGKKSMADVIEDLSVGFNPDKIPLNDQGMRALEFVWSTAIERAKELGTVVVESEAVAQQKLVDFAAEFGGGGRGIARLGNVLKNLDEPINDLYVKTLGLRAIIHKLSEDAANIAAKGDDKSAIEAGRKLAIAMGLIPFAKKGQTESARVLRFSQLFQNSIPGFEATEEAIKKAIIGGKFNPKIFAKKMQEARGNIAAMRSLLEDVTTGRKLMNAHNEYWINALLSGPRTHIVNITSTALNGLLKPGEIILGGLAEGNTESIRTGSRILMGYLTNSIEGFKAAWRVAKGGEDGFIKGGQSILDPRMGKVEYPFRAISSDSFLSGNTTGKAPDFAKAGLDLFGALISTPTRALAAGDEFFKTIMYRSYVQAEAYGDALYAGLDNAKTQELIAVRLRDAFSPEGHALNPKTLEPLNEKALNFAREGTFTSELGDGTIGGRLQAAVAGHPALTLVVPFVRTPTNIFRQLWSHTPGLRLAQTQFREALKSPDPLIRAEAKGKIWIGRSAAITIATLAGAGKLTGSGPSNPKQRELLEQTGWQPYSYVVENDDGTKEYVSYQRVEPFGSLIGVVADMVELSGQIGQKENEELAMAAAVSFATNVVNKSYLLNLTGTMDALTSPDRSAAAFLRRQAGSYVPNALRQYNDDPNYREIRTVLDAIKSRIPGYSDTLPPRRNILGEVINVPAGAAPFKEMVPYGERAANMLSPFRGTKQVSDKVKDELASLGHTFSSKSDKVGNVELTEFRNKDGQDAYDRMRELVSTIKNGSGQTIHKRLEEVISSKNYQAIPHFRAGDYESKRVAVVQQVITQYYEAAFRQMLREFPEVKEAIKQDRTNKAAAQRLGLEALNG